MPPRGRSNPALNAEAKAIPVDKANNIVATEFIFYLSLIGLYELVKYRLACKIVLPDNVKMKSNDIHFCCKSERENGSFNFYTKFILLKIFFGKIFVRNG